MNRLNLPHTRRPALGVRAPTGCGRVCSGLAAEFQSIRWAATSGASARPVCPGCPSDTTAPRCHQQTASVLGSCPLRYFPL
jgi:hypothetical protein